MLEGQIMREDISCRNILTYASYVTEKLGQRFFLDMFKGVIKNPEHITMSNETGEVEALSLEYLVDANNWISSDAHLKILKNISGMGLSIRELGSYAAKNLQFCRLLKLFGGDEIFERIGEINSKLKKTEKIEISNKKNNSATITIKHRPDNDITREICEYNLGYYTGLLDNLHNLHIKEMRCGTENATYECVFALEWGEKPLISRAYSLLHRALYSITVPDIEKANKERERLGKSLIDEMVKDVGKGEDSFSELRARNYQLLAMKRKLEETVAELRKTQQDMVEAASLAAAGLWISEIVHDARNINSAVSGEAQMIWNQIKKEGEIDRALMEKRCRLIIDGICSEQDMFEDTLGYVKGQPLSLEKKEVNLGEYIKSICDEAIHIVGDGVAIKTSIGYSGPLQIDRRKMTTRVINNLLKNAAEAMDKKGEITISTARNETYTEISISDNGPGIPDDIKPRLFERFSTYGKKDGTGLGLLVAKKFVEEHGGRLDVESYTENIIKEGYFLDKKPGTTFTITIPNR